MCTLCSQILKIPSMAGQSLCIIDGCATVLLIVKCKKPRNKTNAKIADIIPHLEVDPMYGIELL